MMACCGLKCESCPIYLATREQDQEKQKLMRESIARQCRELYGLEIEPEQVTDCDGCRSSKERLFSGCRDCRIRSCVAAKGLENCAGCNDYPCPDLKEIFRLEPQAGTRLDGLRLDH